MKTVLIAVILAMLAIAAWRLNRPSPTASAPLLGAAPSVAVPTSVTAGATQAALSPAVAAFCDRASHDRLPADLPQRLGTLTRAEDIEAVEGVLMDASEPFPVRNEAINILYAARWGALEKRLNQILANAAEAETMRTYAAQHLGIIYSEQEDPLAKQTTRARLAALRDDSSLQVRREAYLALVQDKDEETCARVIEGLGEASMAPMRDLLIRCLGIMARKDLAVDVLPFTLDQDLNTRIAALSVLSQWGDERVRPSLEEACASQVDRLRNAGRMGLELLDRQQQALPGR